MNHGNQRLDTQLMFWINLHIIVCLCSDFTDEDLKSTNRIFIGDFNIVIPLEFCKHMCGNSPQKMILIWQISKSALCFLLFNRTIPKGKQTRPSDSIMSDIVQYMLIPEQNMMVLLYETLHAYLTSEHIAPHQTVPSRGETIEGTFIALHLTLKISIIPYCCQQWQRTSDVWWFTYGFESDEWIRSTRIIKITYWQRGVACFGFADSS